MKGMIYRLKFEGSILCRLEFGLEIPAPGWLPEPNRKRRKWSQKQTFFVQGPWCARVGCEYGRGSKMLGRVLWWPNYLADKKQMPQERAKVQLLPITFYLQTSSVCAQFPKPHNFHYGCVWTQITLSYFQEASPKAESAQLCGTQSYYFIRWSQGVAFSPVCETDMAKTALPSGIS